MSKPILVSVPLVPEVIRGKKTLTTRLPGLDNVNYLPADWDLVQLENLRHHFLATFQSKTSSEILVCQCPYGPEDGEIWVRESWYVHKDYDAIKPRNLPQRHVLDLGLGYLADGPKMDGAGKGRAAIHLPERLARLTLQVDQIKVNRLWEMTEQEAALEGCPFGRYEDATETFTEDYDRDRGSWLAGFKAAWIKLNGRESWDLNPWTWRVYFSLKTNLTT
jgi:hypothetical protein